MKKFIRIIKKKRIYLKNKKYRLPNIGLVID